jgi:hypothetical protein
MIGTKRTLVSVLVSLVLVATASASMWLMASAGVFTGAEQAIPGAPTTDATLPAAASGGSERIISGFQVSQPRDPFEPLIVGTGGGDGSTTTTLDDGSSTTTTTGGDGSTTTTTAGDTPDGIRVVLLEVRGENGELVAVVEVDGETSTVGVGDTFAVNFKVVSLSETGGVFAFGDSAFTLAVGQSILK